MGLFDGGRQRADNLEAQRVLVDLRGKRLLVRWPLEWHTSRSLLQASLLG